MGRRKKEEYAKLVRVEEIKLPKGWKILKRKGNYAIVEIPENDLTKVRLLKLPEGVREYFRKKQREYRKRLREKLRKS